MKFSKIFLFLNKKILKKSQNFNNAGLVLLNFLKNQSLFRKFVNVKIFYLLTIWGFKDISFNEKTKM